MFHGLATALVTPFKDGKIDLAALSRLVEKQIESGVKALCPCGTTGEVAVLSAAEYRDVIKTVVQASGGLAFILAGVGGNDTKKVIENTQVSMDCGANGLLAVVPYYNKPTQAGLLVHFETIAKSTNLPIMLYNVPGRTVTDISDDTIARLAEIPNIVALKDASGSLERVAILRSKLISKKLERKFKIYSGDDITAIGCIAMGGFGLISVASNIIPQDCLRMVDLSLEGKFTQALELQDKYATLFDAMFIETNPAPVKYALSKLGIIDNELRLPLVPISEESARVLDTIL